MIHIASELNHFMHITCISLPEDLLWWQEPPASWEQPSVTDWWQWVYKCPSSLTSQARHLSGIWSVLCPSRPQRQEAPGAHRGNRHNITPPISCFPFLAPLPHKYFLSSLPRSTACIQILMSGPASQGTQTKTWPSSVQDTEESWIFKRKSITPVFL